MTETSQREEMKRYLFHEMPEAEREALENRFFEDNEYFYELVNFENDLVDRYARGKIIGNELTRFEKSLTKSPERREKIANARALQTLIAEENPKPVFIPAPNLWERARSFFNLRISSLRLAAGTLAVLAVCFAGFLFYQNWQARKEFAEIEKRQEAERIEKENRLKQLEEEQRRIEQERRQNKENQNQPEGMNGNNQETNINQLREEEKRKSEIEKLRRDVDDSRQKRNIPSQNSNQITPSKEYLAVAIFPIGRGGNAGSAPSAELVTTSGKQMVKITKLLPQDKNYSSYEIASNGKTIKTANITEGAKSIEFLLEPEIQDFEIKVNERNTRGGSETLGTYQLKLTKNK